MGTDIVNNNTWRVEHVHYDKLTYLSEILQWEGRHCLSKGIEEHPT